MTFEGSLGPRWPAGCRPGDPTYHPTWPRYSVKKRAAALDLWARAPRWTDADENHLLWSIDSNASLNFIAQRLGRSVGAVRKKIRDLKYTAESLGGFKGRMSQRRSPFAVRVQYWVAEKLLLTKGGRITDSSVSKFLPTIRRISDSRA